MPERRPSRRPADELGAHVSSAGGVENAPARAAAIGARVLQLFTKQPSRWAEPRIGPEAAAEFRSARRRHRVAVAAAHDSYLINLASPDPVLFERSYVSFCAELLRCEQLGLDFLVSHPGNATDGDQARGIEQNAAAIERALREIPGATVILLEGTAGSGRALGSSFEELAAIRAHVPARLRARVGVCLDTCHLWAAGYDLRERYDEVVARFIDIVGLETLRLIHLNDSVGVLGSRRDRHAEIGEGTLGPEPFRRLLLDPRLEGIPKVLETPKGDDHVAADRRNLRRLRRLRSGG